MEEDLDGICTKIKWKRVGYLQGNELNPIATKFISKHEDQLWKFV